MADDLYEVLGVSRDASDTDIKKDNAIKVLVAAKATDDSNFNAIFYEHLTRLVAYTRVNINISCF